MKGADAPYLAERLLPREELMRVEHSRSRGERRRRKRARSGAAQRRRKCVLVRGVLAKKETGADPWNRARGEGTIGKDKSRRTCVTTDEKFFNTF